MSGLRLPRGSFDNAARWMTASTPSEVIPSGVAYILANVRHHGDIAAGSKCAPLIKIAVETDDVVPMLQQHGHHDGSDIAEMSGNQHTHHCSSVADRSAFSQFLGVSPMPS